jgi:hypothetical protein
MVHAGLAVPAAEDQTSIAGVHVGLEAPSADNLRRLSNLYTSYRGWSPAAVPVNPTLLLGLLKRNA